MTMALDTLIYAGISALPELFGIENFIGDYSEVGKAVEILNQYEIKFIDSIEGGRLYDEFKHGDLGLDDLVIGRLSDYFDSYLERGGFKNEEQSWEFTILNHFFSVEEDYHLSLPLIQFGGFDGVVHIIFEEKDRSIFSNSSLQKLLIRLFSNEYEGLLLDWDSVGENMQRRSTLPRQLAYLTSDEYHESAYTNPIFKECQYRAFYLNSMAYYMKRIEYNDVVPESFKTEYRKRAIIAILIDSYAHNISAHSLTVLKWFFQQRASTKKAIRELEQEIREDKSFKEWSPPLKTYLEGKLPGSFTPEDIEKGGFT